MNVVPCPCGSGTGFDACCAPFLAGAPPPTAEALMRSRYTAFVRSDIDHIRATYAREHRDSVGPDLPPVEWTGLDIMGTSAGGVDDDTGTVDFAAKYTQDGAARVHRENSNFRREDGHWVYVDGEIAPQSAAGKIAKVGRNDPCPCGSGKKFKKCCGA
jgi:SEC-C motif-containing protein